LALNDRFLPLTARELGLLVVLFALTLPAVTVRLYSSDEVQYFSYLRSLWFDHDVSFENEYRHFYDAGIARTDGFRATFLEPRTRTGKRENFGTIGSALLWAPFYAGADAATRLRQAGGSALAADGYSRLYVAAVAYGSATYAFLALLLSIAAARRLIGDGIPAGLALWFGTPLLFYMYAAPPFSHACSAFAVALFVTVWLSVRERWTVRGLVALGASAALMAMVREQDAFYAAGPAADWMLSRGMPTGRSVGNERSLRSWLLAPAAGIATFVLVYSIQLTAYLALNGRLGPSTLVTRKMTWTAPYAAGVLASPQHGLFVWTPLALLAVIGLVVAARAQSARVQDLRRPALCMLLMFALQVYVSGSVESWTVAGAFGQRRFVGATVLFVVGLAALWQAVPRGLTRGAIVTIALAAIWWNVGLMALFGANLMDRQRLHPRENARDVFVTLPRELPTLVFRYFTRRDSFYQTPTGSP
jgi:hypothetical protein